MVHKEQADVARPRGRPRKFDEAVVIDRVRDVFWNNGYAATSLDDIAAATGLNRPSLYAAFGDKHALYLRAAEGSRDWTVAIVREHLMKEGPLGEVLYDLLMKFAHSMLLGDKGARGCFIVCTAVTESLRDPEIRALTAGYVADLDQAFLDRFEQSADELNTGVDPAPAAMVASAMIQTLAVRARTGGAIEDLAKVARGAVTVICGRIYTAGVPTASPSTIEDVRFVR